METLFTDVLTKIRPPESQVKVSQADSTKKTKLIRFLRQFISHEYEYDFCFSLDNTRETQDTRFNQLQVYYVHEETSGSELRHATVLTIRATKITQTVTVLDTGCTTLEKSFHLPCFCDLPSGSPSMSDSIISVGRLLESRYTIDFRFRTISTSTSFQNMGGKLSLHLFELFLSHDL